MISKPAPDNQAVELAAVVEQMLLHFNDCFRRGTFHYIPFGSAEDAEKCRQLLERTTSLTNSFWGNHNG